MKLDYNNTFYVITAVVKGKSEKKSKQHNPVALLPAIGFKFVVHLHIFFVLPFLIRHRRRKRGGGRGQPPPQ